MAIYDDKETLKHAIKQMDLYVNDWDFRFHVYELDENAEMPDFWSVVLVTSYTTFIVTDAAEEANDAKLKETTREELLINLKNFEDVHYKLYYRPIEQYLIGYWLDFFIYYVEMPDKIVTVDETNIELYENIRKQKIKL